MFLLVAHPHHMKLPACLQCQTVGKEGVGGGGVREEGEGGGGRGGREGEGGGGWDGKEGGGRRWMGWEGRGEG